MSKPQHPTLILPSSSNWGVGKPSPKRQAAINVEVNIKSWRRSQAVREERRNVHNEPKPRKPLQNILPRVTGMHQRIRKTPQFREPGDNKLRTNQPTQAIFTVLEIIIPGVKVQVFETENFPPFAPD